MSIDLFPSQALTVLPPSGVSGQTQYNNAGVLAGSSGLTLSATQVTGITYADQPAGRTALGLGTLAVQNANAVAITGGSATNLSIVTAEDVHTSKAQLMFNPSADWHAAMYVDGRTLVPGAMTTWNGLVIDGATTLTGHGIFINVPSGSSRWAMRCSGTAPSYFGGSLQVVDSVGIGGGIDAGGRLHVQWNKATGNGIIMLPSGSDTGGNTHLMFKNIGNSIVGTIACTASATAYNTSSDVRLKHAIAALTGALDAITALRPVRFRWNADDSADEGFLAHELQQVLPHAVTGEPDAVNDDGSVKPQQVDHSKLVVWLVGACQELAQQVAALVGVAQDAHEQTAALQARVQSLEEQLGV